MTEIEIAVRPIETLILDDLRPLLEESLSEGYKLVETLWNEYRNGKNRFDVPGALLLGVFVDQRLIGVGGVQPDPYLNRPEIGRIRHVYVLNALRRHRVGKRLLEALIDHARDHFDVLTLRTNTQSAAAFYEAIGFDHVPIFPEATHFLCLKGAVLKV